MASITKRDLFNAFVAGFEKSAEGFNGELFRDRGRNAAADPSIIKAFDEYHYGTHVYGRVKQSEAGYVAARLD